MGINAGRCGVWPRRERTTVGDVATSSRVLADGGRTVHLVAAVSSVPLARHLVRDDLERRGVRPAGVDNSVLVVTELVTNSILHARPLRLEGDRFGVVLTWTVDDERVVVEVTDGGGTELPRVRRHLPADTGGRGLAIVDAIASDWLISSEESRVTVRAVIVR